MCLVVERDMQYLVDINTCLFVESGIKYLVDINMCLVER